MAAAQLPQHVSNISLTLPRTLGVTSRGMLRAGLEEFIAPSRLETEKPERADAILVWGYKASARNAEKFARRHHLPVIRIEDAFLRSVRFGPAEPALGLVFDDSGLYYDALSSSRLEKLVQRTLGREEIQRACDLATFWRQGRVSKYNHSREYKGVLPDQYILVVDQTRGDLSIARGKASSASFELMLAAALDENPGAKVLVKIHPEVMAGKKQGHLDLRRAGMHARVKLMGEDVHPVRLIENAAKVYTVTSQMGFEALIWGKPVRTFGVPFYAGWGLTNDNAPRPAARSNASFEQLVHASLIDYARYVDPETGRRCDVESMLAHLSLQRQMIDRFPAHLHACGLPRWKRVHVRRFFPYSKIKFARTARRIPPGATMLRWGRRPTEEPERQNITTLRIEDGFLRSVGLGAAFASPSSWVADPTGIYFDATHPSHLESILENGNFDEALLRRTRALIAALVSTGLTKYNVGQSVWERPSKRSDVILVPGQVESDASILYGSPVIRTNLDLLRTVRANSPGSYLLYKPHPDVAAGLRRPGPRESACSQWCDEMVVDTPMGRLLEIVDEVHTMTSLAGFEALLRGKKVVTYGQPFYAGWGLTDDRCPVPHRTRRLSLDELVAGSLFAYPLYVSRKTGRYTTPERAVEELVSPGRNTPIRRFGLEQMLKSLGALKIWRDAVAR